MPSDTVGYPTLIGRSLSVSASTSQLQLWLGPIPEILGMSSPNGLLGEEVELNSWPGDQRFDSKERANHIRPVHADVPVLAPWRILLFPGEQDQ